MENDKEIESSDEGKTCCVKVIFLLLIKRKIISQQYHYFHNEITKKNTFPHVILVKFHFFRMRSLKLNVCSCLLGPTSSLFITSLNSLLILDTAIFAIFHTLFAYFDCQLKILSFINLLQCGIFAQFVITNFYIILNCPFFQSFLLKLIKIYFNYHARAYYLYKNNTISNSYCECIYCE